MLHTRKGAASALAALAMLAALSLAGCASAAPLEVASLDGGKSSTESNDKGKDAAAPESGPLAFAACMREHGIDMPDPDPNDQTMNIEIPAAVSKEDADAAFKACDELMGGGSGQPSAENIAQMREYSACMRENGVEDFPDPGADGSLSFAATGDGSSTDPMGKEFEDADKACRKLMPTGNTGATS